MRTHLTTMIAVIVLVVGAFQLAPFSSPASAEWRDNSDQLPGMEDSSDAIAGGAVVALAVAAVVGIVYAITAWGKKPHADTAASQPPVDDNAGLAALQDLNTDPGLPRTGPTDRLVVTGLSVTF
ncbi:MAG: hypothetical protein AB1451_16180 [Nitrospirota bacterium]